MGAVVLIVIAATPPAAASEVSAEELRVLAQEALLSEAAEETLREVTAVDGVPVDIDHLIGDDSETQARIAILAAVPVASSPPNPNTARDAARDILSQDRFRAARPGDDPSWLQAVIAWITDHIPRPIKVLFLSGPAWLVLGVVALAVTVVSAVRHGRRLLREPETGGTSSATLPSAPDLLRAADDAESAGDYSRAVRLRFGAAVAHLGRMGVVVSERTTTAGMVRRALPRREVADLSNTFERIAYAGETGSASDAAAARVGWHRVLAEVGTDHG
jgi:hypothetical protein